MLFFECLAGFAVAGGLGRSGAVLSFTIAWRSSRAWVLPNVQKNQPSRSGLAETETILRPRLRHACCKSRRFRNVFGELFFRLRDHCMVVVRVVLFPRGGVCPVDVFLLKVPLRAATAIGVRP